jgi:hypothetical protein
MTGTLCKRYDCPFLLVCMTNSTVGYRYGVNLFEHPLSVRRCPICYTVLMLAPAEVIGKSFSTERTPVLNQIAAQQLGFDVCRVLTHGQAAGGCIKCAGKKEWQ